MRVKIDFEIPESVTRGLRIGAPLAVILAAGVAYASLPHTFAAGETLTSANLNADLQSLDSRIAALGGAHVYAAELPIDTTGLATLSNQYPASWVTVLNGTPTGDNGCTATGANFTNTITLNFVTPFATNPICDVSILNGTAGVASSTSSSTSFAFVVASCTNAPIPALAHVQCVGP